MSHVFSPRKNHLFSRFFPMADKVLGNDCIGVRKSGQRSLCSPMHCLSSTGSRAAFVSIVALGGQAFAPGGAVAGNRIADDAVTWAC